MDEKTQAANDDPDIFGKAPMEEDDTAEMIRKMMAEMDKDDDVDDGGFDQPPAQRRSDLPDVVGQEEGAELVNKARDKGVEDKTAAEKKAPVPDEKPETKAVPEAKADPATKVDDATPAVDYTKAGADDLLNGFDGPAKAEIARRLSESSDIMGMFSAHSAELARHNTTPKAALGRLMELNAFAQQKPDEYLAWVSKEMGGENPTAALEGAAKLLGMKLVKDEPEADEDDDFLSDRERELLRENAALKAAQSVPPEFGPDTDARTRAREAQEKLSGFVTETDESGALKRPYFDMLRPQITNMATAHARSTGESITIDQLQGFYDKAVEQMRGTFGAPEVAPTPAADISAAQATKAVADQLKQKAAAAEKAKRASTSIDGAGQGADRRPALSEDASTEDVVRHFYTELSAKAS